MPKSRSSTSGRKHSGKTVVEWRVKTKKKREDLPCLQNRLAEPLGESF